MTSQKINTNANLATVKTGIIETLKLINALNAQIYVKNALMISQKLNTNVNSDTAKMDITEPLIQNNANHVHQAVLVQTMNNPIVQTQHQ